MISLFMVTGLYDTDGRAPIQIDLGLSDQEFLVKSVVAYLIAAAIAFPLGFLLGARFLTAVIMPAVGVMLVGVLLIALVGDAGMLLAGRVLSGLGAGAAVGVTTAVVRRVSRRRGVTAAAVAALGVLAAVLAPFVNQVIRARSVSAGRFRRPSRSCSLRSCAPAPTTSHQPRIPAAAAGRGATAPVALSRWTPPSRRRGYPPQVPATAPSGGSPRRSRASRRR